MGTMCTEENSTSELIDFGVVDSRNRAKGVRISRCSRTYTAHERGWYAVAPGHVWAWVARVTRAGLPYGGSGSGGEHATEEERDAAIARYLVGARKRAVTS